MEASICVLQLYNSIKISQGNKNRTYTGWVGRIIKQINQYIAFINDNKFGIMIDILKTAEVIEACENLLQKRRPPEEIRHKVDLAYRIDNQSVLIYEIRCRWDRPDEFFESPIAKTTWVKTNNKWKVFWMRADLKWHVYKPKASVNTIYDFIKLIDQDPHGCFWG